MRVVRAYKHGEKSKGNRRKYVVPETGTEALDLLELSFVRHSKIEMFPCFLVCNNIRVDGRATIAFRFKHNYTDSELVACVEEKLNRLGQRPARSEKSREYRVELEKPYDRAQWGIGARVRKILGK